MTPIEKLGVEISDFLEQNALVWPNSLRQAWDAAKDAELDKESWAQICDQFDAENPHIGQAAEVAKLLRSNAERSDSRKPPKTTTVTTRRRPR
jgi:hypothetical protein